MTVVELIMPKMGESVVEATIIDWAKSEGDLINEDDILLEVATDKVDSEIPSPYSGKLIKILHQKDAVVPVGSPLALIEVSGTVEDGPSSANGHFSAEPVPATTNRDTGEISEKFEGLDPHPEPLRTSKISTEREENNIASVNFDRFYSPLVKNIARRESITREELDSIPGTGGNGRVTKHDILRFIKFRKSGIEPGEVVSPITRSAAAPSDDALLKEAVNTQAGDLTERTKDASEVRASAGEEIIQMDRMRKLIADHMIRSKDTAAHVTSFVEADVTKLVHWRNSVKDQFLLKHGEKLTFTPMFAEVVIAAIRDFPAINSSVAGDKIIIKKYINLGIATALANGNLIVPIIRNAEELSTIGLAKRLNDLTLRARQNSLKPEEVTGGTFTISNIGTFGNIMGTPIINQPQVAILALGSINKKPVVVESKRGDMIAIRHMMYLSLSYDHRVIDGFLGGSFLKRIADILESFDDTRRI
jgi:2-oxoglutarate dehydrogenase E2 component (dihydrolipoamide succinyltransferase)